MTSGLKTSSAVRAVTRPPLSESSTTSLLKYMSVWGRIAAATNGDPIKTPQMGLWIYDCDNSRPTW